MKDETPRSYPPSAKRQRPVFNPQLLRKTSAQSDSSPHVGTEFSAGSTSASRSNTPGLSASNSPSAPFSANLGRTPADRSTRKPQPGATNSDFSRASATSLPHRSLTGPKGSSANRAAYSDQDRAENNSRFLEDASRPAWAPRGYGEERTGATSFTSPAHPITPPTDQAQQIPTRRSAFSNRPAKSWQQNTPGQPGASPVNSNSAPTRPTQAEYPAYPGQMPISYAPRTNRENQSPVIKQSSSPIALSNSGADARSNQSGLPPTNHLNPNSPTSPSSLAANPKKTPVHLELEDIPVKKTTSPLSRTRRKKRLTRLVLTGFVLLLVLILSWPLYLIHWANSQISHVEAALSEISGSSGETWLIAGTDERSDGSDGGINQPWVTGARTDTIILVRKVSGTSMVVSLPRDSVVEIPEYGQNRVNAAYAFGGPTLLVSTVEGLTGVKVDHYVQVSMGSVTQIVDAVGGVELCYDDQVSDPESELEWPGGCNLADGKTALAFARMRKADPQGDIGRAERQRQVISKIISTVQTPSTYFNPFKQKDLLNAAVSNLKTDPETGIWPLVKMALAYRSANQAGLSGAPPLSNLDYRLAGVGSTVLIDPDLGPTFWANFKNGTLSADQYHNWG